MRFSNPLVSFVATIALVSSVAASATPVRRGGEPSTDSNCNGGTLQCCQSSTILSDAPENIISSLLSILPDVDADTPIGLDCILNGVEGCRQSVFCCTGDQSQSGLINVGLNCAPVSL